jgi:hypothetical protein
MLSDELVANQQVVRVNPNIENVRKYYQNYIHIILIFNRLLMTLPVTV